MATIGELFVELGIVADVEQGKKVDELLNKLSEKANKTTSKMDGVNKAFAAFKKALPVAAITVAVNKINQMTNALNAANQEMINLTRTTDISLEKFQKWGNLGRLFGIRNAAQQIEGLNRRLFELRLTGQGAKGFQLAGIDPRGLDAEGLLMRLRGRVSGMSDTAASYLLDQLGIDPQMLHLLRLTDEEFTKLSKTINKYQLNRDQRKEIQELNKQLQISAIRLQYLKDRAVLAIMPVWTRLSESFARVSEWITTTTAGLRTLAGAIILTLIPAVKALFAAMAAHPVIAAITAALLALYLIIDDIATYMSGGKSVLGDFLASFKETVDTAKDLKKVFGADGERTGLEKFVNLFTGMYPPSTFKHEYSPVPRIPFHRANNYATSNYDNRSNTFTQHVNITTDNPIAEIQRQLGFVNYAQSVRY